MKKPNIIFTIADDQRSTALGCAGVEQVQTPHLDALARRGMRFDRAYHNGSPHGAVCAPSRAMLHTGLPHHQLDPNLLGATFPPKDRTVTIPPTLGGKLRQAGYHCFGTGKWHNGTAMFHQSFNDGGNIFFGGMADHWFTPVRPYDPTGLYPKEAVHDADGFSSDIFSQTAVDFIRSRQGVDQPFFCYCGFTAPHDPRTPPDKYRRMYKPYDCPLPPNYRDVPILEDDTIHIRDEVLLGIPRHSHAVQWNIAEYYGMITHMDHCIGRIHAALAEIGQLENTIIIHTADHGLGVAQHGLMGKQNMYEHSVRVPLIIAGPGISANQVRDALCYQHDLHPTILELLGLSTDGVHFQSLMPQIIGSAPGRDFVVSHYRHEQAMVRDARFKLIVYPSLGRMELYDHQADPWETNDLVADPQYAGEVTRLKMMLDEPTLRANMAVTAH